MHILGLCLAGTSTPHRQQMARFVADVLGLPRRDVDEGIDADLFGLPDGSSFAVAPSGGMGASGRSTGFLVDDMDEAVDALRTAGIDTDAPTRNGPERYVHFTAPDGHVYELIERLDVPGSDGEAVSRVSTRRI